MAKVYGCIEAGGTKFIIGVLSPDGTILKRTRISTTQPEETLSQVAAFLHKASESYALEAIGVATFGPVELDRHSAAWGSILDTPKPGWSGASMVAPLTCFGCPIGLDTDVNGAALAEARWGAAICHNVSAYVTVGTGIGGGLVVEGRAVHGRRHPEMGHFYVKRHPQDVGFAGVCPFHGDCLEGLASGPAIMRRWGASLSDLPVDHAGHEIIAEYLAQMVIAQQAMFSPGRIALGGGVMNTPGLLQRIQQRSAELGGGYYPCAGNADGHLVESPTLGDRVGLLGALAIAADAAGTVLQLAEVPPQAGARYDPET